jgi:hypothetical protein
MLAGCPSCVLPTSTRYEIGLEPSIVEYPFPKEAARFLLHLLSGAEPYRPRLDKRKSGRLLGEHARRDWDRRRGGSSTRVPMMTAYRQEALRCAELLASNGPMKLAALRAAADAPRAATILQQDVYGWFERVERGVYTVSPAGRQGLEMFARLGAGA